MGSLILKSIHISLHTFRSEPFGALLVAVILVYVPLLRDENSSQKKSPPCRRSLSPRTTATADAAHHGRSIDVFHPAACGIVDIDILETIDIHA